MNWSTWTFKKLGKIPDGGGWRVLGRSQAGPRQKVGYEYDTAAALLVTAGDNPERMRTEASFAALCGASPIQASSGRIVRHRLNHSYL